jgi:hypothetical protein
LAKKLQKEIDQLGTDVFIYNNVEDFLDGIKQDIHEINRDYLNKQLYDYITNLLKSDKIIEDLVFKDIKKSELSLYLTERINILSVSFNLDFDAIGSSSDQFVTVNAAGECSYSIEENMISNLDMHNITKFNLDGSKSGRTVYAMAATFGRGTKKYIFKQPLDR